MADYLETERLILRDLVESDVDLLVALDGDPDVKRFIDGGKPPRRADIAAELAELLDEYARYPSFGRFAAHAKAGGEFVGWFALRVVPDLGPTEPELGYRLRRAHWGHGYATEGSRALVTKAFAELGARRVWATTMTANLASRRVMRKAGLAYVRTFHLTWPESIEGTELGDVEYSLTRAAWQHTAEPVSCSDRVPVPNLGCTGTEIATSATKIGDREFI